MDLIESVEKIYHEHLPAGYMRSSQEELAILKELNGLNRKLNPDQEEWEKMDDLLTDLTRQAEKNGFIAGFTYALTFLEKVYGLSDVGSLFNE
jgi:hypothetical protein